MTILPIFKVLAVIGILLGIYFFIEEKLDLSLKYDKDKNEVDNRSSYAENSTYSSVEDQLIEVLLMISSSLKAGRNLDQAFELVAISTPPPICNEFRTLIQERRLGVSIVEALSNLARRVNSPDLYLAVNATIFQQETGGNLEDLYSQIVSTVIERKRIMGKIVAGTAHAKLSGNLVGVLPVGIALIIWMFHPAYLSPMLTSLPGQVALSLSVMLALFGIFIINRMTSSILPEGEDAMIKKNKEIDMDIDKWKAFKKVLVPFMGLNQYLSKNFLNRMKSEAKYLLEASKFPVRFTPAEFLALCELSAILFMLSMFIFVKPPLDVFGYLVLIFLGPVGFRLPRIYLAHLIRRRQQNIEFELPFIIDLLSLAIEAGLDLTGGISKIVEKSQNTDIIVEFKMFLADIKVGKSMEEALSDMAERVRVLSFFSFVSALIQAQKLGADIGPTLRVQAEQMRHQRMLQIETRVNKLPVKLLIPLVFCVFPSLSVILLGPAILNVYNSLPEMISQSNLQSAQSLPKSMKISKELATTTALLAAEKAEATEAVETAMVESTLAEPTTEADVHFTTEQSINLDSSLNDDTSTSLEGVIVIESQPEPQGLDRSIIPTYIHSIEQE